MKKTGKIIICLILAGAFLMGYTMLFGSASAFAATADDRVFFGGGDGLTEETAFEISTAEQLELLAQLVNNPSGALLSGYPAVSFSKAFYKLTADIALNDERFSFSPETGLICITDGVNTAYMGTGILAEDEASQFNSAASILGNIYVLKDGRYYPGQYSGELRTWKSIGGWNTPFQGHFDGNSKSIGGLYINGISDHVTGLFGNVSAGENGSSEIRDLLLSNSLIIGNYNVGGILGGLDFFMVPVSQQPLPDAPTVPAGSPPSSATPFEPPPPPTTPYVPPPVPTTPVEPPTTPVEPPTTPVEPPPVPTSPVEPPPVPTTPVEPPPVPTSPVEPPPVPTSPTTPIQPPPPPTTPQLLNIAFRRLLTPDVDTDARAAVGSGVSVIIDGCSFDGFVLGYSCVGGIVGSDSTDTASKLITDCKNTGLIFASSTEASYAGGILGTASTVPTVYLENCVSTGRVISRGYYCGAIAGMSTADYGYNSNCRYAVSSAVDGQGAVQNGIGSGILGYSSKDSGGETYGVAD